MTTSIDSNVIAALWTTNHQSNSSAARALDEARRRGRLVVCAPVYAELMAGPLRDEASLDMFFNETGIGIDWMLEEKIWRAAGEAFREFARRRKRSGVDQPRRLLADFVIGAHAMIRGYTLLTADRGLYKISFPGVQIASF